MDDLTLEIWEIQQAIDYSSTKEDLGCRLARALVMLSREIAEGSATPCQHLIGGSPCDCSPSCRSMEWGSVKLPGEVDVFDCIDGPMHEWRTAEGGKAQCSKCHRIITR